MSNVFPCEDWRDITSLNNSRNLYLKPAACIHISVQIPADTPPSALEAISTEEVMERIQSTARPDVLIGLKVLKTAQQYIRIEAHLHNKQQIPTVLQRLDRSMLKLQNFAEPFKVRACEAQVSFSTKQDWESFFHVHRNQHDLKPGERPDTVHIKMLPCQWFVSPNTSSSLQKVKPSESVIRSIFECFGPIRNIDIPMLDPYRVKMFPNLTNNHASAHEGLFDAYIQFHEYGSFVKCMTAFRGMILVLRDGNKTYGASIQVDFDRTRHLSDRSIKYRKTVREKLIQEDIDKERAEKLKRGREGPTADENRPQSQTDQKKGSDADSSRDQTSRLEVEQRKMLLAQRRLESLRLLEAVVEQVKAVLDKSKPDSSKKKSKKDKEAKRQSKLEKQEKILRAKLLKKYKQIQQGQIAKQKEIVQEMMQKSNDARKSDQSQRDSGSATEADTSKTNSPSTVLHCNDSDRPSNGTTKTFNRERPKPLGFRSNYNQSYDRRNDGHQGHQGNYPRHNTFNRKRYQPPDSFHSQDSNRQDWKRSRYNSNQPKSNWESNLDSELWDGPEIEFDSQNSRSSYRRGGRSGGDFHHRQRSHGVVHDESNVRMSRNEPRNGGSSFSQSLPDPIERPV